MGLSDDISARYLRKYSEPARRRDCGRRGAGDPIKAVKRCLLIRKPDATKDESWPVNESSDGAPCG